MKFGNNRPQQLTMLESVFGQPLVVQLEIGQRSLDDALVLFFDVLTIAFQNIVKTHQRLAHFSSVSVRLAAIISFQCQSSHNFQKVARFCSSHLPQMRIVRVRAVWVSDLLKLKFGHAVYDKPSSPYNSCILCHSCSKLACLFAPGMSW